MPRKKPEELASATVEAPIEDTVEEVIEDTTVVEKKSVTIPTPTVKSMTVDSSVSESVDVNGDGHISKEEYDLALEFKRKRLEDEDAMRDAQRKMTWFALFGMLLYPVLILITSLINVDDAAQIIGDIAPTYFVAIAGLVAAFFGATAYTRGKG
jgi:uncharacterized integral membrane protein